MVKKICLPMYSNKIRKATYDCNYSHFIRYAGLADIPIQLVYPETNIVWAPRNACHTSISVNDKQLVVDFSDKQDEGLKRFDEYPKYAKVQYHEGICTREKYPRLYPSMPVPDIRNYTLLKHFFSMVENGPVYTANGDVVICPQRPHTRALDRRTMVHAILKRAYGSNADIELTDQRTFWERHKSCLVAIVVPGATEHIFDRGHIEQLALGVCTISTRIDTNLCYWKKLVDGEHFIQCKNDFSDLLDKIEWARDHRNECKEIGTNARKLFLDYLAPKPFMNWLAQIVEE